MHVFWSCDKAHDAWIWILSFFNPFLSTPCTWVHALLGDPLHFSEPLQEVWHIFHLSILFHLWKTRNNIIYGRQEASSVFSLSEKYIVFYDCLLQIFNQAEKVHIEVQHLRNLLDHWCNAPCSTSRLPNQIQDASRSHNRGPPVD